MTLDIISGNFTGLFAHLESNGFIQLDGVRFARMPFRVNGVWRCTVYL